jgi:indole-3-glycerol phosphate synthase
MILDEIVAGTRSAVASAKARRPEEDLRRGLDKVSPPRDFRGALAAPGLHLVAEMKRRSPSAGELRPAYEPARLAAVFAQNGAAAISVLTEAAHFGGALADLTVVREATTLPLLRKDFTVDAYQLVEARLAGADAVLLICRILSDPVLGELLAEARALQLDAIVEVHDEEEVKRALAAGAAIIGINNRDLATLMTDLKTTARLRRMIPNGHIVISESGIRTAQDLGPLRDLGIHAVLVGESILASPDVGARVRELASLDPH